MTVTYPLTLPATSGQGSDFASFTLRRIEPQEMTSSPWTGIQQTQTSQGQWWEADVSLIPMKQADYDVWEAWLLSLRGSSGTFLLGDPEHTSSKGTQGGSPLVANTAAKGSRSVDIKNLTANVTGWAKAGDFFQYGSGATARLHRLLTDVDSGGGGGATLDFWPSARADMLADAPLTFTNPVGLFRLKPQNIESGREPLFTRNSFMAVEALSGT